MAWPDSFSIVVKSKWRDLVVIFRALGLQMELAMSGTHGCGSEEALVIATPVYAKLFIMKSLRMRCALENNGRGQLSSGR